MPNPFIFKEVHPDDPNDLTDYNSEEAYELGVSAGISGKLAPSSIQTPEQDKELDTEYEKILSLALDPVFKAMDISDTNRRSLFDAMKMSLKIVHALDVNTEVNKVLDELLDGRHDYDNKPGVKTSWVEVDAITAIRQRYQVKEIKSADK